MSQIYRVLLIFNLSCIENLTLVHYGFSSAGQKVVGQIRFL